MLKADEPIQNSDQDLLDRGHLVEVVSRSIIASKISDPIVIALNAPWGSGKSSFINLLENHIQDSAEGDSVIFVRFNPWNYSDIDQLVLMFFQELGLAIKAKEPGKLGKDIGKSLTAIGSVVGHVPSSSGVTGLAGVSMKTIGEMFGKEQTLSEKKRFLNDCLRSLEKRIIIFIDDVDRLERQAIRLLFKLIRLNADFINTTYVLAFDRKVVEKNLDEDNGIKGRDYLEKIVQVSYDIPAPETTKIYQVLDQELDQIIREIQPTLFDDRRWKNLFHSGLKHHFTTMRHVRRFTNSLKITLAAISNDVDIVDYIGIELIRVFHPEIYEQVAQNGRILTHVPPYDRESEYQDRRRAFLDELCGDDDTICAQVRSMLKEMFPQLTSLHGQGFYREWRVGNRICSPEVFPRYFLLSIPDGEISTFEMHVFLEALSDLNRAIESLKEFQDKKVDRNLLKRVWDYLEDLSTEQIVALIKLLFEKGDELRYERRGLLDTGDSSLIPKLILNSIKKIKKLEERQKLVRTSIESARGIYTLVQTIAWTNPNEADSSFWVLGDGDEWLGLREMLLERISSEAKSSSFWKNSNLRHILHGWIDWGDADNARRVVSKYVESHEKLMEFLGYFVYQIYSQGVDEYVSTPRTRIDKKLLSEIVSIEDVESRLSDRIAEVGEDAQNEKDLIELLKIGNDLFER